MPADRFRLYDEAALAPVIDDMARQAALLLDAGALAASPEGSEVAGDREWRWQRSIAATPVAGLQRIDIQVHAPDEQRVVVATQVFRGTP